MSHIFFRRSVSHSTLSVSLCLPHFLSLSQPELEVQIWSHGKILESNIRLLQSYPLSVNVPLLLHPGAAIYFDKYNSRNRRWWQ